MLFCTSLVAFVGAGEQPHLTPRKLSLLNTHSNAIIQNLSFPSTVLAVQLNRKRYTPPVPRTSDPCTPAAPGQQFVVCCASQAAGCAGPQSICVRFGEPAGGGSPPLGRSAAARTGLREHLLADCLHA